MPVGRFSRQLARAGSSTFNASSTFTVPFGVRSVSISGFGGKGNSGNSGNPGTAGNAGNPGGAGGGGGAKASAGSAGRGGGAHRAGGLGRDHRPDPPASPWPVRPKPCRDAIRLLGL
mgnify:CR=1 FL=1